MAVLQDHASCQRTSRSMVLGRARNGSGRRRRDLLVGVEPAGLNPTIEAVAGLRIGDLRIDATGMQQQAAEAGLDMTARAAEPVVKIEVAKRRVEIVVPQPVEDPTAEPNAFRIAGRPAYGFRRFG